MHCYFSHMLTVGENFKNYPHLRNEYWKKAPVPDKLYKPHMRVLVKAESVEFQFYKVKWNNKAGGRGLSNKNRCTNCGSASHFQYHCQEPLRCLACGEVGIIK